MNTRLLRLIMIHVSDNMDNGPGCYDNNKFPYIYHWETFLQSSYKINECFFCVHLISFNLKSQCDLN